MTEQESQRWDYELGHTPDTNPDCEHEWEWKGGGSTPDGPIEPEQVCKHCGAINLDD